MMIIDEESENGNKMATDAFLTTEDGLCHRIKSTMNNANPFKPSVPHVTNNNTKVTTELVGLKRRVGLLSGTALIVGTMIGSGIFVSPKGVLQRSGSIGLSLIVWTSCGIVSLLGALCYAELGTLITKSGAEYSYILEAFGGLPAFLFSWVSVFILKPAMLAIICLTLSEYVVSPFYLGCEPEHFIIKLITILAIGDFVAEYSVIHIVRNFLFNYRYLIATKILGSLQCHKILEMILSCVSLATGTQNVFTAAKLIAIIIIVIGGLTVIINGETKYIATGFEGSHFSFSDIATAFYSGLWAYDGWNNLNYITEELINPYRNLPLAIICGIPMVTLCYVMVNVSYMTVMPTSEILSSKAVAVNWGARVLGSASVIMPIAVAVSSFGAGNGSCFTSGRLSFAAAREGHLVDVLSFVDFHRFTPSPALIFNAVLAICYVIPGNIESLIDFFSFTAWLFYGLTMLSLVVLRYKSPYKDYNRPYKVHLSIPIGVSFISFYLVIAPILENPQIEYLYASLYIVGGAFVYIPFVYYKIRFKMIDPITIFCQKLLHVVPSEEEPLL